MLKELNKSMIETYEYKGYIKCTNCKVNNPKFEADIDKGVGVKTFLRTLECENCGVKGKITD